MNKFVKKIKFCYNIIRRKEDYIMAGAISIITNFIHKINSTITVGCRESFCANVITQTIYIETQEHPKEDELIQNFVQEHFHITMDPFLIGLLHEVGHLMTYTAELDEQRTVMYALLSLTYDESEYEKYSQMYFQIPAELAATTWAVEYYKSHIEQCEAFLDELFMR